MFEEQRSRLSKDDNELWVFVKLFILRLRCSRKNTKVVFVLIGPEKVENNRVANADRNVPGMVRGYRKLHECGGWTFLTLPAVSVLI
jgi:hypothetical protein